MKRTLDVMVVPVDREPELKTLESDENGSFLKALQRCVGGLIEPLSWLFDDAPAGYCNEEGALGATFLDANRAVYADKAMEDAGFLSQLASGPPCARATSTPSCSATWCLPGSTPIREKAATSHPRSASASASASAARNPSTRAQASFCPSPGLAGPADEALRMDDDFPEASSRHLPLPTWHPPWAQAARDGARAQGLRKTFR